MIESLILSRSFQAKSKHYIYVKTIIIKLEFIDSFCATYGNKQFIIKEGIFLERFGLVGHAQLMYLHCLGKLLECSLFIK